MKPIPSVISNEALDLMQKAQTMITRIDALTKAKKCKDCGDGKCNCKDCPDCGGKMNKMGCKMGCGKMAKAGDTFTIGDQLRENNDGPPQGGDLGWKDYQRMRELEDKVGEEEKDATSEESAPLPHSEQKIRDQKRGEEGRGRNVFKRPDDENAKKLTSEQRGIEPVAVTKSGDEGSQPTFNTTFSTAPQDIAFVSESGGQTRNAGYSTNQHLLDSEDVANKGATSVSVSLEKLASMLNPHEGGGSSRLDDNGVLKSVCEQCGGNQYSGCRGNCPNKKNLN